MKLHFKCAYSKNCQCLLRIIFKISILGNLSHWKEVHPDQEVVYKCQELDRNTQQTCIFSSKESEEIFKHRSKHKIRETPTDVKPDVTIE